jgi:hypothetical protein
MVGVSAALVTAAPLLAAGRQQPPPPVRVRIPTQGLTDEIVRALRERLGRMDGITDVSVARERIEFTVAPGRTVCVSSIRAALDAVRGDHEDARLDLASLTLSGDVEVHVDGLDREQSEAVVWALAQVDGVMRVDSAALGRFTVHVASARGVAVSALDEAIAGAVPRGEGEEPFRVTDVCWTAPEPRAEQPGNS